MKTLGSGNWRSEDRKECMKKYTGVKNEKGLLNFPAGEIFLQWNSGRSWQKSAAGIRRRIRIRNNGQVG